jgi:hypothetical protein
MRVFLHLGYTVASQSNDPSHLEPRTGTRWEQARPLVQLANRTGSSSFRLRFPHLLLPRHSLPHRPFPLSHLQG